MAIEKDNHNITTAKITIIYKAQTGLLQTVKYTLLRSVAYDITIIFQGFTNQCYHPAICSAMNWGTSLRRSAKQIGRLTQRLR